MPVAPGGQATGDARLRGEDPAWSGPAAACKEEQLPAHHAYETNPGSPRVVDARSASRDHAVRCIQASPANSVDAGHPTVLV